MLGVSPRASCSCRPPLPISPTTTKPGVDAEPHGQADPSVSLQTAYSASHGLDHARARYGRRAGHRLHGPADSQSRPAAHRPDTGQYGRSKRWITSAQVAW